jgi:hypothetical protein
MGIRGREDAWCEFEGVCTVKKSLMWDYDMDVLPSVRELDLAYVSRC